jgi:glycosyltransferase involved in cell wall biosynthesis
VVYRCVKHSRAASALGAQELVLRREVFRYHRHVDRFVSPSAYLREVLIQGGLEPRRVVHIPNYVQALEYEPRTEPGAYALYVGRLSFEKGLWTLLEAAARLPRLEFRVVGRGPEGEALEQAVRSRELSNVRLEGFRQGEELRALYRGALCVVMPSEWPENGPMVVYEAFASGKPVVGTTMGGIPELVQDGIEGRIVPPADPAALADALSSLAMSPSRVREMGERALEKARTRYDLSQHVDRLLELYGDVLAARRRAPRQAAARTAVAAGSTAVP